MKKLVTAFIAFTLFSLYSIFLLTDYNTAYKNFLANNNVNFAPSSVKEFKLRIFPFPSLYLSKLNYAYGDKGDSLNLEDVELRFSILSLLKLQPQIKAVKVANAKIYAPSIEISFVNHDALISKFLVNSSITDLGSTIEINNILFFDKGNKTGVIIKDFALHNNDKTPSEKGKKRVAFKATIQDTLEAKKDEASNVSAIDTRLIGSMIQHDEAITLQAEIVHQDYEFKLTELYQNFVFSSGKGNYKIKNLPALLSRLTPELQDLSKKIGVGEVVEVNFDMVYAYDALKNRILQLDRLTAISKTINGSGQLNLSTDDKAATTIALKFDKVDLKNLLLAETAISNKKQDNVTNAKFAFADKVAQIALEFGVINLPNDEILRNTRFIAYLQDGKLSIKDFSAKIFPSNSINSDTPLGEFKISGDVTQNAFRSIFDGKTYLKHQNLYSIASLLNLGEVSAENQLMPFIFTSDLKCTLIDFDLQNMLLKTDKAQMLGDFSLTMIADTPRISANLKFSEMDLDKDNYPVLSSVVRYSEDLFKNMQDKSYLNKFIPIRKLSYIGNLDIEFSDLNITGRKFDKVDFLLNIEPNNIRINNVYISAGEEYVLADAKISAADVKPRIELNVNEGLLRVEFLTPGKLLEIRKLLLENYALDKVFVNLDIKLPKLYQNDFLIQNLKFKANNNNILLTIPKLEANLFNGKLIAQGSVLLDPYTWNFVYAINSMSLAELSKALPAGVLDNQGVASINGMFSTNGDNLERMLYNLYTKSSIIAKNTRINNFSVGKLITAIADKNYKVANLNTDLKTILLTGITELDHFSTDFTLSNGVINLKDTKFKNKQFNGVASGKVNIYDFVLSLSSNMDFKVPSNKVGQLYTSSKPVNIGFQVTGSWFQPQKNAEINELIKALQSR